MKTITTSKTSLLTILGLASVLILVALAFVGLFLAQRMQAVKRRSLLYCQLSSATCNRVMTVTLILTTATQTMTGPTTCLT